MDFSALKAADQQYIAGTYARFNLGVQSGHGALCTDFDGKEYVDFSAGIAVNSLGFSDPQWVAAVQEQAAKLAHISNLYYTEPGVKLAKALCEKTGFQKVFFANSGAEANECAIKAARKYSCDKYGSDAGRNVILSLQNSFHGRTVTTLAATGQAVFHQHFFPFTEGFAFAEANNLADTTARITDKTCAVMMEMVQGEGGVMPLEEGYVQAVAELCAQRDILLIVDEVQTGIGRTGKFFCFEHYGVQPDLVTMAKGLGGGLPIGGVLFGEKTQHVLGYGDHGSTFGMNPIACAGALVVVERMTDPFLAQVAEKGAYLAQRAQAMEGVASVSGRGMMLGLELTSKTAKEVAARCIEEGLIVLTAKTKVRLLPPLTITREEMDRGLAILAKVLAE